MQIEEYAQRATMQVATEQPFEGIVVLEHEMYCEAMRVQEDGSVELWADLAPGEDPSGWEPHFRADSIQALFAQLGYDGILNPEGAN